MDQDHPEDELSLLPHGAGFRFVDSLVALVPGKSAHGTYRLRGDEPFLAAHFPGRPMMPGVLLIEAAAQLAGIAAQSDPGPPRLGELRLAAVRSAKITGTAAPGETLEIHAQVDGRMENLVQARATVSVKETGDQVLTCSVTLSGVLP